MNNENFDRLEAWLQSPEAKAEFDMRTWYSPKDCGSVMCMGGFCQVSAVKDLGRAPEYMFGDIDISARWLGIVTTIAYELFYPNAIQAVLWKLISPEMALKVVRHYRETKLVNWSIIYPELEADLDGYEEGEDDE